jgi:hypothetical protein
VLQHIAAGAGEPDLSVLHYHTVAGQPQPRSRVLLDEQDRGAGRVHLPDRVEDRLEDLRRQAHGRLVQQQQDRLQHQRAGEFDQPLLPAGQAARLLRPPLRDLREQLEDGVDPLRADLLVAEDVAAELDVFPHGHVAEQAVVLRHLHHPEPQDLPRRLAGQRLAMQADAAAPRP